MRIDRLRLETPTTRADLHLHSGITFITGLGAEERSALGTEIVESVRQGRPGLSVDVVHEDGRLLEIYRPIEGTATVHDAISGVDFTDDFLRYGSVDLLSTAPLPESEQSITATNLLRVTRRALTRRDGSSHRTGSGQGAERSTSPESVCSDSHAHVARLARLNQDRLWATAMVLAETEVELASQQRSIGSNSAASTGGPLDDDDSVLRDLVEQTHHAVQIAADRLETDRTLLLASSATLSLIGVIGAILVDPILAIPFVIGALATGAISAWRWRELALASQRESASLAAAGLSSYTNLRLGEITQAPITTELRTIHTLALATWIDFVGSDIDLAWAIANKAHILDLSVRVDGFEAPVSRKRNPYVAPDGEFAAWLDQHLLGVAQTYGQAVPVVIEDDFLPQILDLGDGATNSALADHVHPTQIATLLRRHAPGLQLIVMTDNAELLRLFPTGESEATILRIGSRRPANEGDLLDLRL